MSQAIETRSQRMQPPIDLSDRSEVAIPVLWQLQISHYVEKVRWALDYKRVPHIRRSLLPGLHAVKAMRLTGDTSTAPVLTIGERSIGDSMRIIAAIEERWPQPSLYPEDPGERCRALELEDFFDEQLGPHIRRASYHELLPRAGLGGAAVRSASAASGARRAPCRILGVARGDATEIRDQRPVSRQQPREDGRRDRSARARDLPERLSRRRLVHRRRPHCRGASLRGGAPSQVPYPMVADHDLPDTWREFLDSLAQRPRGQWVADIYRHHRGSSAELSHAGMSR
jgi:glutathione S-transferase